MYGHLQPGHSLMRRLVTLAETLPMPQVPSLHCSLRMTRPMVITEMLEHVPRFAHDVCSCGLG